MVVPSSFLLPAVGLSLYTGQPKNTRFPADPSLLLTWILLPFQHQVHLAREPGHHGLVRPHHVEELAPGGEAGLVVAGAGGRLGLDGPAGAVGELHVDEPGHVLLAHVCLHAVAHAGDDLAGVGEDGGRHGFLQDRGQHRFLVAASLVVPVPEAVPLPGEGKGLLPVQGVDALPEGVPARLEGVLGLDVHAPQGVHDGDKGRKVHPGVVGDVYAVQVLQRVHGHIHAVDARVGQLVPGLARHARQGHVVVPGRGRQEDLLRVRVHGHDDVHVAAAVGSDGPGHVDAADVDVEGLLHVGLLLLQGRVDAVLVEDPHLVGVALDGILDDPGEGLVVDGRVDGAVKEGLALLLEALEFHGQKLPPHGLLDVLLHQPGVVLVHGCLDAKAVVACVQQVLGHVVLPDHDDHVVCLVGRAPHVRQQAVCLGQVEGARRKARADEHAQDDPHKENLISHVLQPEGQGKQKKQHHRHGGQILQRHHAAVPGHDDERHGQDELHQCDQFACQMSLLFPSPPGVSSVLFHVVFSFFTVRSG